MKSAALTVKPVRIIEAAAGTVVELDAAIARLHDELAVLKRAKEIVLRG